MRCLLVDSVPGSRGCGVVSEPVREGGGGPITRPWDLNDAGRVRFTRPAFAVKKTGRTWVNEASRAHMYIPHTAIQTRIWWK